MTNAIVEVAPLLASWMAACVVVASLLATVAMAVQRVARGAFPVRLVWGLALLLAVGLSTTQPWRQSVAVRDFPASTSAVISSPAQATMSTWQTMWSHTTSMVRAGSHALSSVMRSATTGSAALVREAPVPLQIGLVVAWPASTIGMLVLLLVSYRRHRRLAARGHPLALHGVPVRVSDDLGPLVVGAMTPEIIVPRWLFTRSDDEQRLVVQHERAHVEAHDPLVLLAGCVATAAMPWNPALWFMLARLRLAIELDCDARVLARGASPRRYGQLLIELSSLPARLSGLQSAPAFSYRPSHLERRLHTMTARQAQFRTARRLLALLVATTGTLAACRAELPTSAELQGMDVVDAERRVAKATGGTVAATEYTVDGKQVSEAEAKALSAKRIASINIVKRGAGTNAVAIMTRDSSAATIVGTRLQATTADSSSPSKRGDPLLFVDGVRTSPDMLNKIPTQSIESIEVIKGSAATALYGADGANGVIVVKMKK